MKIGLVVCPTLVKQPFQALKQMELIMQQQVKNAYDLLVFPQAYLQGIYAISDDANTANRIAIRQDSKLINKLRSFCAKYCLGVAFGFYEKDDANAIYDSFMIVNREGKIRSIQRQLSSHWGETAGNQGADNTNSEKVNLDQLALNDLLFEEAEQKELLAELEQNDAIDSEHPLQANFSQGDALQCSFFAGKRVLILIGQDLVQESLIEAAASLEPDIVLCPDALALTEKEYDEHKHKVWPAISERLDCPLLIVNGCYQDTYVKGGALAYIGRKFPLELKIGEMGILPVEL
ncbi:nitrilase-related carbon-nitrogen hydrolase [Amygdalobacter nucleatus]|uniref:CN hydrolase domain-containing protein n=1 Tax=Amygdalobacter nucleatus TaxID=3029274 RepID=A0A133YFR6_9FIRM|nr:nitrilase-related carbon-nitrogen hydrolase [Amygdalobacter nucleatus]KXB41997.1 hypothetical protein HMPREF1872_00469 [Amygdalobacter nucleatus]MDF0485654.1 hypothetical protein [Amygdalobacter nucleatus]WEG36496.1 hypothetical protein PYS63_04915 [Amygdalobacter nucleatus]